MTQTPLQRKLIRLASAINTKAQRLGARGRVTAESLFLIILASRGPDGVIHCPYCGVEVDPMSGSFDHRIPFDLGGSNERENILFCCLSCNRKKFTKSIDAHLEFLNFSVACPVDGTVFKPRYADWKRGYGLYCSRSCSASSRWMNGVTI